MCPHCCARGPWYQFIHCWWCWVFVNCTSAFRRHRPWGGPRCDLRWCSLTPFLSDCHLPCLCSGFASSLLEVGSALERAEGKRQPTWSQPYSHCRLWMVPSLGYHLLPLSSTSGLMLKEPVALSSTWSAFQGMMCAQGKQRWGPCVGPGKASRVIGMGMAWPATHPSGKALGRFTAGLQLLLLLRLADTHSGFSGSSTLGVHLNWELSTFLAGVVCHMVGLRLMILDQWAH